jgi:hypothetical protein
MSYYRKDTMSQFRLAKWLPLVLFVAGDPAGHVNACAALRGASKKPRSDQVGHLLSYRRISVFGARVSLSPHLTMPAPTFFYAAIRVRITMPVFGIAATNATEFVFHGLFQAMLRATERHNCL